MTSSKPVTIDEYKKWLKEKHGLNISVKEQRYYDSVTARLKADFEKSEIWVKLGKSFAEYNDIYRLKTGYPLMRDNQALSLLVKPFDSFILKTYRKNILDNKNWPNEPANGWILPKNWFSRINDVVRTLIEVKYLDGVGFIEEQITATCKQFGNRSNAFYEAREEGYYAAHIYIQQEFEIPKIDWNTEKITVSVEIQITTQLQEVIRKLLHDYYEDNRKKPKDASKWQWNYKSDEFSANYLGHILHYVEGMILEVRDKQKENTHEK
jgi:hypothetical protein